MICVYGVIQAIMPVCWNGIHGMFRICGMLGICGIPKGADLTDWHARNLCNFTNNTSNPSRALLTQANQQRQSIKGQNGLLRH